MLLLLKAAIQNRKHYVLLIFTTLSMFLLTASSQLEIISLGVIAKSAGPDFFVLFGKNEDGKIEAVDTVSIQNVQERWKQISDSEMITKEQASAYLSQGGHGNLIRRVNLFLDKHFKVYDNLPRLAGIVVMVALIKAIALFGHRYFTQVVSIRVSRDLRQRCFEHVQTLPMSFYHRFEIATVATRVTGDAGSVANSINSLLTNYIQTPFAIISTFSALLYISWKLTMVIVLGFPLIILPVSYIARKIKYLAESMAKSNETCMRLLFEHLTGILTIKTFVMESFNVKKYKQHNGYISKMQEKSARYGLSSRPILHVVSSIFFAAVMLAGLYVFEMNPAELLVYCGLMYVFYEPVKKFADENIAIQQGVVAAERMFTLLNEKSTIEDAPDAIPFPGLQDTIEFKNVSFSYHDEPILKNLSFTVKRGEIVAIVGPTGAGKSTIVSLLPRLYDIKEGDILFDGQSIKRFTQHSLRKHIAFVPQKPFLFLDSIRENIAIGREYSDENIQRAAKNAHAEEFIVRMPGQYNYVLEEMGKNLSGGQQQRLSIARALATQAPILIMDEATSSLDALSEEKIRDAILEQRGKLTQIIIAHRFSTIEHADKIIYLDHGRKVAEGSKQELLQSCPEFKQMWDLMHLSAEEKTSASSASELCASC
jgi:ABC-type multidrug transport system fused ATPase/permease subunit